MPQMLTLFEKGGPVMWPLLVMSVISVALTLERGVFWVRTHRPGRRKWLFSLADALRTGDRAAAKAIAADDSSLYADAADLILARKVGPASAVELAETFRPVFDRFSLTLSTVITAAPLLGILGTVTGIIRSFQLLGGSAQVTDINAVAGGIAEALITTAAGLVVALITLFPYMVFRAQSDRCLGNIELLVASATDNAK
ncbi:MAG: MotA/TolQ/ExbB proton channel family protein [Phycisphaeraceae bacterium]|nr:MotA/TolQ/ExbB proton channel family protein [Phycisphaeraceae bacterium]